MINNILYISEIIFLISLIFASISSVKTWILSKRLTKDIKKTISNTYPLNLPAQKYQKLNQFLIFIVNKAENNDNIIDDVKNLQNEFNIPKNKIREIENLINNYAQDIKFWNKYGKLSGYTALITGALSFTIFYLIR